MMKKSLFLILLLIAASCTSPTMFKLLDPEKTGVHFINRVTETDSLNIMSYEYIYNGAGVGTGDLNNDGLMDLVFAGNQVPPAVYLNLGNFKFKDISSNLSPLPYKQWLSGVAIADINSDGWLDIYMTSTANNNPEKCKNRLWINQGMTDENGPYFIEMAEQYGVADTSQSVSAAFFDYDCDGDLDLYILNNTLTASSGNLKLGTPPDLRISSASSASFPPMNTASTVLEVFEA